MSSIPADQCAHRPASPVGQPAAGTCAECGLRAPTRLCLWCGHVGCCDSTNGHATAHALASGHPVIRSLPLTSDSFTWCYECNAYLK